MQGFYTTSFPYYPFMDSFYFYPSLYESAPQVDIISLKQEHPQQPQIITPKVPNIETQINLDLEKIRKSLRKLHSEPHESKKTHWSQEQDQLLRRLIQIQKVGWKAIPSNFEGRTQNMCYSRYRRMCQGGREKGWTKEQESSLVNLVASHGERWKRISQEMPKFTAKQIRERYLNYLRPNINKSSFEYDEDFKICQFVLSHGKQWRRLEELLPGRPQGAIKGRYYGKLQELMQKVFKSDKNKIK